MKIHNVPWWALPLIWFFIALKFVSIPAGIGLLIYGFYNKSKKISVLKRIRIAAIILLIIGVVLNFVIMR